MAGNNMQNNPYYNQFPNQQGSSQNFQGFPQRQNPMEAYNGAPIYQMQPIQMGYNMPPMMPPQCQNCLKGRPVTSIEEARAAQIDLDGSLHIFTDIGNNKIYTKQLNIDGTTSFNTFSLVEENGTSNISYVTQEQLDAAINQIKEILNSGQGSSQPVKF